jgi:hypothetical protein
MTNGLAIALAALLLGALAWDALAQDWAATLFLGRKGLALVETLAFWR